MIVPASLRPFKPSELLTPQEREERYGQRSLVELRKDVNLLFTWKATAGPEKDRQQLEILSLQIRCNWALAWAIFGSVTACIDLALLCYLAWH
jgi:hypothetical protein